MTAESVVPWFGGVEDRDSSRGGRVVSPIGATRLGTRRKSSEGGAAFRATSCSPASRVKSKRPSNPRSAPSFAVGSPPRPLPPKPLPESPSLVQLLAKVPAKDRAATAALVEDLRRVRAPEDLIRWHILKKVPGAALPVLRMAPRKGASNGGPTSVTGDSGEAAGLGQEELRSLPWRIQRAILALSPEGKERVESFAREGALLGLTEEAVTWNIARHLGLLPKKDDPEKTKWVSKRLQKKERKPRDPYMTENRENLLGLVWIEQGRTCELARRAELSDQSTLRALKGLEKRGYVSRHEDGEGNKVWGVTRKGTEWLNSLPEIQQGLAEGPVQTLFLLEEKREMREKLRRLGWSHDQCRDVVPHYTLDHLVRQFTEVTGLHEKGQVYNPGGLLWWRLGIPARGLKWGKKLARNFIPPKARGQFVTFTMEHYAQQELELRLRGLATQVVPDGLGGVFLDLAKAEPFHVGRRLAYTLAKQAKKGRRIETHDVHETLHWIRKDLASRGRLWDSEEVRPHEPDPRRGLDPQRGSGPRGGSGPSRWEARV